MKQVKIEKNVPRPTDRKGPQIWPWDRMEVGDSFFVPGATPDSGVTRAAHMRGRVHGEKYQTRKIVENGVTGIRVWRIA